MKLLDSEKIVKTLTGFSNSSIYLIQNNNSLFIRKVNDIDRNYERMTKLLSMGYPIPNIYRKQDDTLDIEYISGLDIKSYIKFNDPSLLIEFVIETLNSFKLNSVNKDYTTTYEQKLNEVDFTLLPFSKNELMDQLPKILPQSVYHGDLTLENIIYSKTGQFYMIDPVTIEYDSWVFDVAKMRQDLTCKWFIRNDIVYFDTTLHLIEKEIFDRYPITNNDYLLILMLLRVYRRSNIKSKEHSFLLREIIRLWK